MPLLILLFLIGLPLAEISVFIEVGDEIGAGNTILLTVVTAIVGIALARVQGFAVMARMQASVARGQPPVAELIHGFFLFLGGVLLFIPGFLTDGLGVLLLLPPVRMLLARAGLQRFAAAGMGTRAGHGARDNGPGDVEIEGVFWEGDSGAEGEDGQVRLPPNDQDRRD